MNYYNEWDPYCAQWLRNLIKAGLIPKGEVDERSISDIRHEELRGFTQCHFFAGIGGWSRALELAGWPEDREVWTGSCPCQPFSIVGKREREGFLDIRHLWPDWFRLISERKPATLFGEQVANALSWIDLVLSDLETINYACGSLDIPAAGTGARHQRQRLWFIADSDKKRWQNAKRIAASEKGGKERTPVSMVFSKAPQRIRGSFEPGEDWIVNGLSGEGDAVRAYGNAIVPQVAAEFIQAYLDCRV